MKNLSFRKMLGGVLAAVLALSLAACSGSKNSADSTDKGSDGGKASASGSASTDNGAIDTSKFVTVSYVMLGNKPTNGQFEKVMEKVNALLKQKANANLEIKWVEWADWQTKYNLLLASGESLDLITTATDWLDAWPNAQKGAFMALDDLLPKYAPLTWQEVPQEDWAETKYKNQIMMIPEDHYTQWVNHGFIYRGDWAKELGITSPIKDFETLGQYFQGIKDKKPGVIPWDSEGTNLEMFDGYVNSYSDAISLPVSTGPIGIFYAPSYDQKFTAGSPVFEDTFLNFAKLMKEWGDKSYWRQDVLSYKGDAKTALEAGKSGGVEHHTQTFLGERYKMDQLQPGSELQFFPWSATRNNLVSMSITHGATALGAHSKNPERALMVYDLLRQDPEIYKLFNYGIEGVQYVVKDGKRYRPDGYDVQKDDFYSDFWGGRIDKNEIPDGTLWDGYKDLYASYDQIKKPYPYGRFVFDKNPVNNELTAITQVVSQSLPAIVFGKAGDPEKAVNDFRNQLKSAGYDKVVAELQKQLDAYKQQIGG
ncbi:ABC transporter substrate-binding protein [Cohnella candidum]